MEKFEKFVKNLTKFVIFEIEKTQYLCGFAGIFCQMSFFFITII